MGQTIFQRGVEGLTLKRVTMKILAILNIVFQVETTQFLGVLGRIVLKFSTRVVVESKFSETTEFWHSKRTLDDPLNETKHKSKLAQSYFQGICS